MQLSEWFHLQLQASAESLLWSVDQIPQERLYLAPRADHWPIARLIYHLVCYEQRIAIPSMLQWAGGPKPVVGTQEEDGAQEESDWNGGQGHEVSALLANFRAGRARQLALCLQFDERDWYELRDTIWGYRSLKWVVTKTYQHTLEHTDEVLRAYLWWK